MKKKKNKLIYFLKYKQFFSHNTINKKDNMKIKITINVDNIIKEEIINKEIINNSVHSNNNMKKKRSLINKEIKLI